MGRCLRNNKKENLLLNHENLSLPGTHIKRQAMAIHTWMPHAVWGRGRRITGAFWLLAQFQVHERACLRGIGWRVTEKDT